MYFLFLASLFHTFFWLKKYFQYFVLMTLLAFILLLLFFWLLHSVCVGGVGVCLCVYILSVVTGTTICILTYLSLSRITIVLFCVKCKKRSSVVILSPTPVLCGTVAMNFSFIYVIHNNLQSY